MIKRAKNLAKQLYPDPKLEDYDDILVYRADRDNALMGRSNVICVYEQAEKETIERAIAWLEANVWEYTGLDHAELSDVFRKAMEEEQ